MAVHYSQSEGIMLATAAPVLLHGLSSRLPSSPFTSIIQHLEYCLVRAPAGCQGGLVDLLPVCRDVDGLPEIDEEEGTGPHPPPPKHTKKWAF